MKKNIINLLLCTISAVAFSLLVSCSIGLGEAVDTKGPAVTISSPEPRETVQTKFNISGTVADDYSINSLIVRIQKNEWQEGDCFEWKNTKGVWQYKARGTSEYVAFADGVWQQKNGNKNATWAVNNIDFSSMPGGSYEVVVIGSDDAGNDSADSKKTRTIIVDDMPPVITITSPSVKDDITVYSEIEDYRDITKISTFTTGDFTVSGIAKDENTIVYIDLYIKNEDSTENYFVKRLVSDTDYAEGKDYIMVDTLRAWDVDIKLKDCGLGKLDSKKHMLKIVTESCDISKNTTVTTQGFFCLWKEADTPWISLNLGTSDKPLSVYAGSSLMGNAYDDTAVDQVTVTIKENGPGGSTVSGYSGTEIYKAKEGEAENNVFFSFKVPENVNVYYVEINEKDNKGNSALAFTGYIEVVDKTYPSMEIKHKVAGEEKQVGESLFGNADGDFEFEFTAKDDTKVSSLKVVYITNPEDVVKYANKDAPEWNDESKMTNSGSELKNGKVLVFENPQQTGNVNESGIDRKVYRISLALNLFTDLGIDGNSRKLSNQTFVVRTEDEYHNAMTKEYTILGDINAPKVEFTKIVYNGETITNQDDLLDAFVGECSVTVYGKIGDDSYDVWKDKGKLDFKLAANEKDVSYSLSDDGTFKAAITSREILKGASLSFKATVTDWAGNSAIGNYSFVVDTSKPRAEYIYAKQTDGCYGVGKEIDIRLRFNKPLKLAGAGKPEITLNNGAVVQMETDTADFPNLYTEGEREYSFKYTIGSDEAYETDRLTVAENGFNLNGCTIADGKITQDMVNELTKTGSGANLGDRKTIIIKISEPAVSSIAFDESTGIMTITFTKKVKKNQGKIVIRQKVEDSWHEDTHEGQSHSGGSIAYVIKAPPVLSEAEYRLLVAKQPGLKAFYESGTNGATGGTGSYVADTTPKYILKYDKNVTDSDVIASYLSTENHVLSAEIGSNKVEFVKDLYGNNTEVVKVNFGSNPLPCKGAQYKIVVPAGIVIEDVKIGTGLTSTAYSKEITASGVETPVIRIKKTNAVIKDYVATQPLKTEFKVDCETFGAESTFVVREYSHNTVLIASGGSNSSYDAKGSPIRTFSDSKILGVNSFSNTTKGLEYEIETTATRSGTSDTATSKQVAYLTIIVANNINNMVFADKMKKNYGEDRWYYGTGTGQSNKIGLFIRGGNNISGPNSIEGYPTTWDINDYNSDLGARTCLLTKDGTNDTFYFATWAITDKYYFRFYAGLMDSWTNTDDNGKGMGPTHGIYAQNGFVPNTNNQYARPGQRIDLECSGDPGKAIDFSITDKDPSGAEGGKAQKYR